MFIRASEKRGLIYFLRNKSVPIFLVPFFCAPIFCHFFVPDSMKNHFFDVRYVRYGMATQVFIPFYLKKYWTV